MKDASVYKLDDVFTKAAGKLICSEVTKEVFLLTLIAPLLTDFWLIGVRSNVFPPRNLIFARFKCCPKRIDRGNTSTCSLSNFQDFPHSFETNPFGERKFLNFVQFLKLVHSNNAQEKIFLFFCSPRRGTWVSVANFRRQWAPI